MRIRTLIVASYLLVATGCGEGRPTRVPVSGRVTIDGEPLRYGYVRFVPEGARPSGGRLDADGKFSLSCYADADGAVLGAHKVSVHAAEPKPGKGLYWHAPKTYRRYDTSEIEVEIEGPTDAVAIDLTWNGGQPYLEEAADQPVIHVPDGPLQPSS